MVRVKPDELEEQVKQQEDEVYGTSYTDGEHDKYDDTEEMLEDVIGNTPAGNYDEEEDEEEDEGGFTLADAIDKDEKAIQEDEPEDKIQDRMDTELDAMEKKDTSDE